MNRAVWRRGSTEWRDHAVLRRVGYSAHATVESAIEAGRGKAAVARLAKAGMIERDEEWTGCLVLTVSGQERLALEDAQ